MSRAIRLVANYLPSAQRLGVSFAWAVAIKVLLAFLLLSNIGKFGASSGSLMFMTGDGNSYLLPAEHFLTYGSYQVGAGEDESLRKEMLDKTRYGRMPGFAAPYILFRIALSKAAAQSAMVLLQIVLSAVSVVASAWLAFRLTRLNVAFLLVFVALGFSEFTSSYDIISGPTSMGASLLVLTLAITWHARETKDFRCLLLAGFLATWSVFCIPYLVFTLPFVGLFLLWPTVGSRRLQWRLALLWALPFVLLDGAWTVRNYVQSGVVQPLSDKYAGYDYYQNELELFKLVGAWGCDRIEWQPNAEIRWFTQDYRFRNIGPRIEVLPSRIYCSAYDIDSLKQIREEIRALRAKQIETTTELKVDTAIGLRLAHWRDVYATEKPFEYYLINPARLLIRLIAHSGTTPFNSKNFRDLPISGKLFRLIQTGLYLFGTFTGLIFILLLPFILIGEQKRFAWVMLGCVLAQLWVLLWVFQVIEYRYLTSMFAILWIASGSIMGLFYQRLAARA
jgi:hypothetical protein